MLDIWFVGCSCYGNDIETNLEVYGVATQVGIGSKHQQVHLPAGDSILGHAIESIGASLNLHEHNGIVLACNNVYLAMSATPVPVQDNITFQAEIVYGNIFALCPKLVVLSHDDYWSNLACVACIAGLFAIRRYLIRRHELKEEMIDEE